MTYQFPTSPPPDVGYILKPFEMSNGDILFDWILRESYAENPIPIPENSTVVSEASR